MPREDRATDPEREQRIEQIVRIRSNGGTFENVKDFAESWGLTWRQLRRYMSLADGRIEKACEHRANRNLALHLKKRQTWISQAVEQGDYRTALALAKDEAQLQGLYRIVNLAADHEGNELVRDAQAVAKAGAKNPAAYPNDPVGYMRDILGLTLTPQQTAAAERLLVYPHRLALKSANNTGKSALLGGLINWHHDNFNPGVGITTAPNSRQIADTCWKEVRSLRMKAGLPGLKGKGGAPALEDGPNHYSRGYTVSPHGGATAFQGRHDGNMFFVFEEATGISAEMFEAVRTMHKPDQGHMWICVYNPTDVSCRMKFEEDLHDINGDAFWSVLELTAFDHPNIAAELEGKAPPIPNAITKNQLEDMIASWCTEIQSEEATATDFFWPPPAYCERTGTKTKAYRPGPEFQARAMGRWPDEGTGLWSDVLWAVCCERPLPLWPHEPPELGVDCAQGKGDDFHAIHTRWGAASIAHETSNTMDPKRIFERIKECCRRAAAFANAKRAQGVAPWTGKDIKIKIDDDGTGNAIASFLRAEGYSVYAVGAGTAAVRPDRYPRKRDELWFEVALRAKAGQLCLRELKDEPTRRRLKQQLLAVTWELKAGRRCVEAKEDTKEKIGRSPDDADAMNLAYYEGVSSIPTAVEPDEPKEERKGGAFWRGK